MKNPLRKIKEKLRGKPKPAADAAAPAGQPMFGRKADQAGAANTPVFGSEATPAPAHAGIAAVDAATSSIDDIVARLADPGTSFVRPPAPDAGAERTPSAETAAESAPSPASVSGGDSAPSTETASTGAPSTETVSIGSSIETPSSSTASTGTTSTTSAASSGPSTASPASRDSEATLTAGVNDPAFAKGATVEARPVPRVEVASVQAPAAPPPPVVEFRKVTKTYANGFTAIKDVTFKVEDLPGKGEFVCVLGPSGCGKSTILRLIAGLSPQYPATTGEVLVAGRQVDGPGADRGMVFQDYTSFDNRTVLDNIAFGLECQGVPRAEREARAREWIQKVGLNVERDAYKYPHQLSGGMRQRVAIARSLALTPRIILMDEPFGALDPATRLNMQDLLVKLWHEASATVFFITHSVEEAVYLGDRVYIMSPCPGTILEELKIPAPDFPSREMQRHPEFLDRVFDIRDKVETLEESVRAGT